MTDKHYRFAGVLGLVAAIGSTAVHRAIYEQAKHGPAQVGEFAAGLMTFVLACAGILLLVHGARLLERTQRTPDADADAQRDRKLEPICEPIDRSPLDSRHEVGSFLAARAIASAAARAVRPLGAED
ncbi:MULTISPECIES: hypothetical protein [unclassified Sphingomonas]|uniref:hypothetical protein n=1 Tax=unclassified Sphingomonas TaxID=196159 RepID=UPI00226A6673|nr:MULTISPECIES: hypothetical protein [unclassified Sphingomonas]